MLKYLKIPRNTNRDLRRSVLGVRSWVTVVLRHCTRPYLLLLYLFSSRPARYTCALRIII